MNKKIIVDKEMELYYSLWKNKIETGIEKEREGNTNNEQALSVLIVENDKELMNLLEDIFSNIYIVHKAENGSEGWNKTEELQPDIVISETHLPGLSGKDLCRKIKSHISTSSIPVILISTQSSIDDEIESYAIGADEYITKPFDIRLLLVKCSKQLKGRNKTGGTSQINDIADGAVIMNENDRKLHDDIILIIKQNFDNPNFDMNTLASELKISRSTMFTRFKELFDMTPNELTLKLKLEEAMRMLKEEHDCNVSEISYKLGFNSPQYFSRIFKNTYGITPQSYRKGNIK